MPPRLRPGIRVFDDIDQMMIDLIFKISDAHREALRTLPWDVPITEWKTKRVRLVDVKRGVGRHPLVFAAVRNAVYAIKEISPRMAAREAEAYGRMRAMGIDTLIPVGTVTRRVGRVAVQSPQGTVYENDDVGHSVTLLVDKALPDSRLFGRGFQNENRLRILDALVDLFVSLHANGVFWGDASLANALVRFTKEEVPLIGMRTVLKAYLADAETVEFHPSLSDSKRRQDLDTFAESMRWIDEDLRLSGVLRGRADTDEHIVYMNDRYEALYQTHLRQRAFEDLTGLSLETVLGKVTRPEHLSSLRRHIDEHKWYLSEQAGKEVPMKEASTSWFDSVFVPITKLFRDEGVLSLIPGRTAAELYVEIMQHKYFLSKERGADVGMAHATRDYILKFGSTPPAARFLQRLTDGILSILGLRERQLFLSTIM